MFNKNDLKYLPFKAWGMFSLCLYFLLVFSVLASSNAKAQSNDFSNRLDRLENELETLNRAVYNGERPPPSRINSRIVSNDATAQMEVRIQNIEEQMRSLTGRIEEQMYSINQLRLDVANLRSAPAVETPAMNQSNLTPETYDTNKAQQDELARQDQTENSQRTNSGLSGGDATALYESAYASLKNKEYDKSREKFQTFLREYPNHILAANSKYWLGETYYVQREYQLAAKNFAQGFQKFPDSAKSPDMLLKLGLSLSNSGKKEEACIALSQLPVRFKTGSKDILDRGIDEMDRLGCSS